MVGHGWPVRFINLRDWIAMLSKRLKSIVRSRIKDGRTLRSIARDSRISAPHLCRWLQDGSSLGQAAIDRLATEVHATLLVP